jgi:hypothetical protein
MTDLMDDRWNKGKAKGRTRKTAKADTKAKAAEVAAKVDEKAKADAEKKLPGIAKDVVTRLDKAQEIQGKADDHRLAAALKVAEAKKLAQVAGIPFKKWAEDNIKAYAFETVRKLAVVGESDNPQEALTALREKVKEANKKLRDKRKDLPKPDKGSSKKEAIVDVALKALDQMPDTQRRKLIESVANNEGLAVVSAAEAGRSSAGKLDPMAEAKASFAMLTLTEKRAFADWAQAKIDEEAKEKAAAREGDMPAVPASLRRTRKTAPVAEAAPAPRQRRTRKAA